MALKRDGTVVAWGYDGPETKVPAGLESVIAITAGGEESVAIVAPNRVASIGLEGQSALLRFRTFFGRQYSVESSPDLQPGSWSPLPEGNIIGTGDQALVRDPNALRNAGSRFYRVREQ